MKKENLLINGCSRGIGYDLFKALNYKYNIYGLSSVSSDKKNIFYYNPLKNPILEKSLVKKITFYIYLILKRLDLSLCLNDVKDETKSTQKMIEGTPSFINKDKINEMCLKDDEVKLDSEFLVDIFKNYLLEKINNKCDYDKYVMKLKKYLNCL